MLSLLVPNRYTAVTSFTVDTPNRAPGLGDLSGLTAQLGLTLGTSTASPYLFVDLSLSDTVLTHVAELEIPQSVFLRTEPKATISAHYKLEDSKADLLLQRTVERLRKRVDVTVNARSSVITLSVSDNDPGVAAWLAEAILEQMQHYLMVARTSRAKAEREFLETRTTSAQASLNEAEEALASFLSTNRVTGQSPLLQMREAQLRRRIDVAQALYEGLARDLERARTEEVRDTPTITVLTSPQPPLKKSSPHRLLIAISATFAALLLFITRSQWEGAVRGGLALLGQ